MSRGPSPGPPPSALSWLSSPWLAVRVQIGLGAIFLAAAWPKLSSPPTFAKNVFAYDILPDALVNLQAILLPGVELVIGLALVLGLWRGAASLVAAGMVVQFMLALSWALLDGNPVSCSCFDLNAVAKTEAELLSEMRMVLLRDVGILALALHGVWMWTGGRAGAGTGTAAE